MARSGSSSRALTDREDIQGWAEERQAKPACVRNTGDEDDIGIIRLDFPGYSGSQSLEAISWDEWFDKFDESNLALLVQDQTADGELSNFNKLISRDKLTDSQSEERSSSGRQQSKKTKSNGPSDTRASGSKTTSRVGHTGGRSSTTRRSQSKSQIKKKAA